MARKLPKQKKHLISVVIPAYKQQRTIKKDLQYIKKVLSQLRYKYEMIVVVDGMVDKTFTYAKKVRSPFVHVFGYKHNHGKGFAIRYGTTKATGDIVAFIDAGMDLNPNGLSMLLEHFEWYNADIIVGSKLHPASKVKYPYARRILSWGYRMLTKTLFGLSVRDTQVGMKIFKSNVIKDILPRLLVKTYAFDIEMLAVANYLGYKRIFEAPVELDFKGASTISSKGFWRTIFFMLRDTLAVFYRLRILGYYNSGNKKKWRLDPELNLRVNLP